MTDRKRSPLPHGYQFPTPKVCERCGGCEWVCEEHPSEPFNHGFCSWPGDPCPVCQPNLRSGQKVQPMLTKIVEGKVRPLQMSDVWPSLPPRSKDWNVIEGEH